ncbi:hypothetical protein ABEB36_007955 [Hypothenemus hampei]|uniref:MADF domain-containing protein n=1 Tax=Hypothenemus hampei TaxID=57062 RepID=A0ABD1EVN7_HYPHA
MVRNKWKTLGDKFRTTLASIPKLKSGDAATNYKVEWKYFQNLLFLKDQFVPRNHSGNFQNNTEEEINTIDNEQMMVLSETSITSSPQSNLEDATAFSSFSSIKSTPVNTKKSALLDMT